MTPNHLWMDTAVRRELQRLFPGQDAESDQSAVRSRSNVNAKENGIFRNSQVGNRFCPSSHGLGRVSTDYSQFDKPLKERRDYSPEFHRT